MRRINGPLVERLPRSDMWAIASNAIAKLGDELQASPPGGVTSAQVVDFFSRKSTSLTESLADLLRAQSGPASEAEEDLDRGDHHPDPATTPKGHVVKTLTGGAIERDVLNYQLTIRGTWGRKRNPDFHIEALVKGVDPALPKRTDELLPLVRKRLAELKVRPGASIEVQEQPVTLTKYPGQKYEIESHVLFSHRVIHKEIL